LERYQKMRLIWQWRLPWSRRKGAAQDQETVRLSNEVSPKPACVTVLQGDCSGGTAADQTGVQGIVALLSNVATVDHAGNGNGADVSATPSTVAVLAGLDTEASGKSNGALAPLVAQLVGSDRTDHEDRAEKPPAETPSGAASTRHAALLVEGDAVHALVLGRLLRACGYEVQAADSDLGAVQAFRRSPFGLVLIDCDTPEIDGFEVAATLRAMQGEGGSTPLIAVTSETSSASKAKRKAAGFDNYLEKPARLDKLNVLLSRYARSSPKGSAAQFPEIDNAELSLLCQLRSDGQEFLRQFVRVFVVEAHQHLNEMRAAAEERRPEVLAHHARALAALSRQIGAARMRKECDAISAVAFSDSVPGMAALLGELSLALERVDGDLRHAEVNLLPSPSEGLPSRWPASSNGGPIQPQRASRVLVAEGNAFQARFLATALSVAGHDVYQAQTGREALKLFHEVAVDVAILDANTPEGDGYFVLNELRMDPNFRRLPVMILSDRYREQEVLRAFELGADDYLPKPFNPVEVSARVRGLLRRA
jgi:DNA-binding response OmpR family regulator